MKLNACRQRRRIVPTAEVSTRVSETSMSAGDWPGRAMKTCRRSRQRFGFWPSGLRPSVSCTPGVGTGLAELLPGCGLLDVREAVAGGGQQPGPVLVLGEDEDAADDERVEAEVEELVHDAPPTMNLELELR